MKRYAIALVTFVIGCTSDTPAESEDSFPLLAGQFVRLLEETDEIMIRNATLAGESFGDSVIVRVNGSIRRDGTVVDRQNLAAGDVVSGLLDSVCVDETPRRCGVAELMIE